MTIVQLSLLQWYFFIFIGLRMAEIEATSLFKFEYISYVIYDLNEWSSIIINSSEI